MGFLLRTTDASSPSLRGGARRLWFVKVVGSGTIVLPCFLTLSGWWLRIPWWWVVAEPFLASSSSPLDGLGALVGFRSVEICSVHGCCSAVTTPECLEAAFVSYWWDWI
ncbi:transmembrane protein, putative [Medicago truncatula]|uniref:Transmembrane protein, putative n=1 Tax=Medicago truncatula TaxID=3880 RepID=G7JIZ9_MEDTR|nr:transmembrane protein, putative [Medicago truncatula]